MKSTTGLIREFVTETKDHLESLEEDFLALEAQKNNPDKGLIDKVFRVIHTIKGNAGFFQLKNIDELSHIMETILSCIRSGQIVPGPDVIDALLDGIDTVNELLLDVEQSDEKNIFKQLNVLKQILEDAGIDQQTGKQNITIPLVDINGRSLDYEIDEHFLKRIPRHHDYLYYIKYNLKELLNNRKMSPVVLIDKLLLTGDIIMAKVTAPFKDLHEGLPGDMQYCVLYSTVLDPDLITQAVYSDPDHITQINLKGIRQKLEEKSLITDDIIEKFISESGDFLDKVESEILTMEQHPDNSEAVDEAFRFIHSIKGNAGFFNFQNIEQKSEQVESILSGIREKSIKVTGSTVTTLLQLIDVLRKSIDSLIVKKKMINRSKKEHKQLGEILIEMGVITGDTLETALQIQERKLGEILIAGGKVSENNLKKALDIQDRARGHEQIHYSSYVLNKRDIRVDMNKLDKLFDLMGELVTAEAMVINHPDLAKLELPHFGNAASYLSKITREIQEIIMSIRMVPLEGLFNKMRRLVRDLSRGFGKKINLAATGQETEMDRNVIEMLSDPLIHIIRNAVDHGIEDNRTRTMLGKETTGRIGLHAKHEGNEIWISVEDDGAGLSREKIIKQAVSQGFLASENEDLTDPEVWQFVFEPGFSTAEKVSKISGRGVGLDVVKRNIEKLRGTIQIYSIQGKGTTIVLKIPLTLAIIEGVLINVGNHHFTIPITDISEFHKAPASSITRTNGKKEVLKLREHIIPIIILSSYFHISSGSTKAADGIIIISRDAGGKRVGFLADRILSFQQIVIKALPGYLENIRGISGLSISGNGDVNLILDTHTIIREVII